MSEWTPRVVVDVSVHCGACRSPSGRSASCEVVHRGVAGHLDFLVSPRLVIELATTLLGLGFPPDPVADYLRQILDASIKRDDVEPDQRVWCRDARDLYLLMLARTASAWRLVTVDGDLLDPTAGSRSAVCVAPPDLFLRDLRALRGEPDVPTTTGGATFP